MANHLATIGRHLRSPLQIESLLPLTFYGLLVTGANRTAAFWLYSVRICAGLSAYLKGHARHFVPVRPLPQPPRIGYVRSLDQGLPSLIVEGEDHARLTLATKQQVSRVCTVTGTHSPGYQHDPSGELHPRAAISLPPAERGVRPRPRRRRIGRVRR